MKYSFLEGSFEVHFLSTCRFLLYKSIEKNILRGHILNPVLWVQPLLWVREKYKHENRTKQTEKGKIR